MKLSEYVSSKGIALCFLGIGGVAYAGFSLFIGSSLVQTLLVELAFLLIICGWLFAAYLFEVRRFDKLEKIMLEIDRPYLLGEVLPIPVSSTELRYFKIMKTVSRSAIGLVEDSIREKEDYCAYVESFIHEIKTPLTACSLILSNDADPRKLRRELKRADNLTESILYYARMRTLEKDTIIKKLNVAQIMEEALKSEMELLIAARIRAELHGDFIAHTDGKSLCFIIKQLLLNCAKYCPGCQVVLTAENGTIRVWDNGPGIPSHELPRVTDRGFTGTSGDLAGRRSVSTGMGLYLVKGLCEQLGIGLLIESEPQKFTAVSLSFQRFERP